LPVLSLQIILTPPIVSQVLISLTRLLSKSIYLIEYARERVRGSPSGMATTTTVIAIIT
jgi:hypothetical protein